MRNCQSDFTSEKRDKKKFNLIKMSRYTDVKVNLSQGQIDKIKSAVKSGTAVSIQLLHEDLAAGNHV